ncbi:MAG: hypothetical protein ACK58L_22005 [Planctomycetota bacterium]
MDADFLLSVISRWIHVGTAIVLAGGATFIRFVLSPSLQGQPPELMDSIRGRWKKFVHTGIALLILTGFFNYIRGMSSHHGDPLYHGLIGTKMVLAFVVFFFASVLVGRSAGTQKFRDQSAKWTGVVVLLSAIIVAMSGVVKVRDGLRKGRAPAEPPAVPAAAETTG